LIESEVHEQNVAAFSGGSANMLNPTAKPRELEETAGIPTGIGMDIAAQVEKRRQRDAARIAQEAESVRGDTTDPNPAATQERN
jgi:hypothetical protein